MAVDTIDAFEIFSLIMIVFAFAIFARLAIKGKSLGSFRFQLSIFMLIWVLSEIPHMFSTLGLIDTASYSDIGLYLHATSMGVFAIFVGWRSIKFLTIQPTPATGGMSVATKPPERLKGGMD
jgi:hypothetical protein